jgi:hypothetical protein
MASTRDWAIFTHFIAPTSAALVAVFLPVDCRPQEILGLAHQYLQRHGVPCLHVLKVDSTYDKGHVAVCQDGREWVLLWVENEVAFVHPKTRDVFKWQREVFAESPEIYEIRSELPEKTLVSDDP